MDLENYYGRRVLVSRYEVKQSGFKNYQQSELTLVISDAIAAIMSRQNRWVLCHKVRFYCPHCINLGRCFNVK